jgi:hypothetical protein
MAASSDVNVWHCDSQCGKDAFQTAIANREESERPQPWPASVPRACRVLSFNPVAAPKRTPCSAPTLEGFAPRAEPPEIAEAQALIERLA